MGDPETHGAVECGLDAVSRSASVGEIEDRASRRHDPKTVDHDLIDGRQEPGGVDRPWKRSRPSPAEHGELDGVPIGSIETMQRCSRLVADPALCPQAQQADHQPLAMRVGSPDDATDARRHPLEAPDGDLPRPLRIAQAGSFEIAV